MQTNTTDGTTMTTSLREPHTGLGCDACRDIEATAAHDSDAYLRLAVHRGFPSVQAWEDADRETAKAQRRVAATAALRTADLVLDAQGDELTVTVEDQAHVPFSLESVVDRALDSIGLWTRLAMPISTTSLWTRLNRSLDPQSLEDIAVALRRRVRSVRLSTDAATAPIPPARPIATSPLPDDDFS